MRENACDNEMNVIFIGIEFKWGSAHHQASERQRAKRDERRERCKQKQLKGFGRMRITV